jgi:hypothetical protein
VTRRSTRVLAALVVVAALAGCGSKKEAATSSTTSAGSTGGTTAAGGTTTTTGATGGTTASTLFPSDALNVCDIILRADAPRVLSAPPTAEPIHGSASKSRGSCEIRSESTHLRLAQFPLEELADQVKAFADAKPCVQIENANSWPDGCMQSATGGILAPLDAGTAIQVVDVKASGTGLKPMAGTVNAKGIIVVSGLDAAKTQKSAGVLLGLL